MRHDLENMSRGAIAELYNRLRIKSLTEILTFQEHETMVKAFDILDDRLMSIEERDEEINKSDWWTMH